MSLQNDTGNTPLSRAKAKEIVSKARLRGGDIEEKTRRALGGTEEGRDALEVINGALPSLEASTRTLATDVYSEGIRFIYELIQNAEDNRYSLPINIVPFLHFTVHNDKIIVDSNEAGFREDDVVSICRNGQSSKRGIASCIGEKGIGFKSIFTVAKKVHIQSEPFSFSLHYDPNREDGALGMIQPKDEDFECLPSGVNTRMTLTLHDSVETETLRKDLSAMPCSLLLFLAKLKEIRITYRISGKAEEEESTNYRINTDPTNQHRAAILFERRSQKSPKCSQQEYYVFEREVTGLVSDERRPGNTSSKVKLAFPVTAKDAPVLLEPYVFAFLPLRKAGFKFLLHSDFLTTANREDVMRCERNSQLLDGAARCFVDAVEIFGKHPILAYEWIEYLSKDRVHDPFWKGLITKILENLTNSNILLSRREGRLYKPCDLRRLPHTYLCDGEPVFDESNLLFDLYISPRYKSEHLDILHCLGLEDIKEEEILLLATVDLMQPNSRLKRNEMSDAWHTKAAKSLMPSRTLTRFEASSNLLCCRVTGFIELKNTKIIPLTSGNWVSAERLPIYYPCNGTSSIPRDLGLRLVTESAVQNQSRKELFDILGVTHCRPQTVIEQIYSVYNSEWTRPIHPEQHLRYLFENLPESTTDINSKIYLLSENKARVWLSGPKRQHIYFDNSDGPYSAGSLFKESSRQQLSTIGVHFILPSLLHDVPTAVRDGRSFQDWLEHILGVMSVPALVHHCDSASLSNEFDWIINNCPEKLVGLLKEHWRVYDPTIQSKSAVKSALCEALVPVENCDTRMYLQNTYLPLPRLKKIVQDAGVDTGTIPYLRTPTALCDEDYDQWKFLKSLRVGTEDNTVFYIKLLKAQKESCKVTDMHQIRSVYRALSKIAMQTDKFDSIRSEIDSWELVCVPDSTISTGLAWCRVKGTSRIYWNRPESLAEIAGPCLAIHYPGLDLFFNTTLRIPDFDWRDAISLLKQMKEHDSRNTDQVCAIYRWLANDWTHHNAWDNLRSEFKEHEIVLWPEKGTWHHLTSCVWAKPTLRIPRKQSVASPHYAQLADFFTRILGLPPPDLSMYIQTLKDLSRAAGRGMPWNEVKNAMVLISSEDPKPEDLTQLKNANIFPVRTKEGAVRPTTSQVEFAIVDRVDYKGLFPKVNTLNFSLTEVHSCRAFLLAMGLGRKFMSDLVKEQTTVGSGSRNLELTSLFQQRAYAYFRCAVFYSSAKTHNGDKTLFSQLRATEIFTSDDISRSLTLMQGSKAYTTRRQQAKVHVDEHDATLKLYVPEHNSEREICYLRQLPLRLLGVLRIADPAAEAVITGILNSTSLDIVDAILQDAGVIEVTGIQRPSENELQNDNAMLTAVPAGILTPDSRQDIVGETQTLQYRDASLDAERRSASVSTEGFNHFSRASDVKPPEIITETASAPYRSGGGQGNTPAPFMYRSELSPGNIPIPPSAASLSIGDDAEQYRRLLSYLVDAARTMTELMVPSPGKDLYLGCGFFASTAHNPLSAFSNRSRAHDVKIGAAGELFVFELLSKLSLPGFGLPCWKSSIRDNVNNQQPSYMNLEPCHGPEEADIEYTTSSGMNVLLHLLARKGYLPLLNPTTGTRSTPFTPFQEIESARHSSYYQSLTFQPEYEDKSFEELRLEDYEYRDDRKCKIEVKATLGDCKEPFIVSQRQYNFMLKAHESTDVYILMRVFHLERKEVGLRIYVDPIAAKERGDLRFEVAPWKVVTVG